MNRKEIKEWLECNEPVFEYQGKEYGICFVEGKFVAGEVGKEENDQTFDTVEELLQYWKIEGMPFYDVAKEIQ